MTCQEIIAFLMHYLDGELPPEERCIFEEHLGDCPPCIAYLESYRQTIRASQLACAASDDPCAAVPEKLVKAIVAACRKQK